MLLGYCKISTTFLLQPFFYIYIISYLEMNIILEYYSYHPKFYVLVFAEWDTLHIYCIPTPNYPYSSSGSLAIKSSKRRKMDMATYQPPIVPFKLLGQSVLFCINQLSAPKAFQESSTECFWEFSSQARYPSPNQLFDTKDWKVEF